MDVLFSSIDVRDLLSSHELDESSPLSAPDLRLLIDRLHVRSLDIKSKVRQYLLSHHQEFSYLFDRCLDTVLKSEQLADRVSDLSLILDHPVDAEIRDVVGEIARKRKDVKENKELKELVEVIFELSEKLRSVKDDLGRGRLVEAAEAVRHLKAALRIDEGSAVTASGVSLEAENDREPVVYKLLRKEWEDCFKEIQDVLIRSIKHVVWFEQDANAVQIKYRMRADNNDQIELNTILEAMHAADILDYGFAKVADLIVKYIITPAVKSRISLVEKINHESGQISDVVLKIVSSPDHTIENEDVEAIYSVVTLAVKFFCNFLCFQKGSWIHCLGRLTWPRIADLIISNFLSKVVPDDSSKLAGFQDIIKLTSSFETNLEEMMFIYPAEGKDGRLSSFVNNVEVHFAARKKVELLAKSRNLLLKSEFLVVHGSSTKLSEMKSDNVTKYTSNHVVDLLFTSYKCVVSNAACQLMELVHQTLKDVCLSSSRVGLELYHAARDALLLYEAIIPVKLKRQLDGINEIPVLIHNDCLYLSQEIIGLSFEYRSVFPSFVKEIAAFVDLALRFHLIAEDVLQRQVQLVIYNLREAIDGADGFQNTHQVKHYETAKFSIDQVGFILEKVRITWEPLLLPYSYKRSMCLVLEAVFSGVARDILLLDDVAAEETLQLQKLVHLMLENLRSLLESLAAIKQTGNLQEGVTCSLEDFIPSLKKIRKLADLLDMPLKSITEAWENGDLINSGFTSSEAKDIIRAIFTDSPLRKECLRRIEAAIV